MITLENQLWLWVEDCEARKPLPRYDSMGDDKVVRVLQYGVREGSEAKEAGVVDLSRSSKLQ